MRGRQTVESQGTFVVAVGPEPKSVWADKLTSSAFPKKADKSFIAAK